MFTVACRKDLDQVPLSSATTATFYLQTSDFIQGTNAIYNSLRGYPTRAIYLSEIRSDNLYNDTEQGRDWDPLKDFAKGIAPNNLVEEAWASDFSGIFRANTVLDQLKKNGNLVGVPALANRLTAEARCMRGFFYFDLVRYFGKVPITQSPVTAEEAKIIPRSPVADVYQLIMADLQFAIANLPANYAGAYPSYVTTDVGKPTKFAAEAMLAQVYMARSSATYNIEGPGMATNEWGLALPLLQDIISNGGFVFNPNYANIFAYSNTSPLVNKEAVFDIMYISGLNPILGSNFPWQLAPATYFSSINAPSSGNGSLGIMPVSNNLLSSYESGDVRKAITIFTNGFTYAGSFEPRPFFKKYVDINNIPKNNNSDWGVNYMVIRYTDVLMMKAECILRGAPGTPADVEAIINPVRVRAGLTAKTGYTIAQLFDERRREFADEGYRWFDLQRSGDLVNMMNNWASIDDKATPKRINTVTNNYVIYPVPQSQINAAPGLYTQNPGY
ncbi:RagB/SusD family nutrient uptake outer membrane protein [Mucilaginibacter rivuli]|uniref:RagB/SusD family nutrient uptake outer membrane protein n=1 Tax=Mucilaginibacter rivuli TaxID=2857527 RepID=UPI002106A35E|nr:RagB/SusD family nutrient uptake outer membrane protein [Mucilaginibacter rivuli]